MLSIIRLRSTELGQHEIAYYFASLALGLLGGLGTGDPQPGVALMVMLVAVVAVADSRLLQRGARQQIVVLDSAITDEAALVERLELVLDARVHRAVALRVDLVNDSHDGRRPLRAVPATGHPGGERTPSAALAAH